MRFAARVFQGTHGRHRGMARRRMRAVVVKGGIHFAPDVVGAFVAKEREFDDIARRFAD